MICSSGALKRIPSLGQHDDTGTDDAERAERRNVSSGDWNRQRHALHRETAADDADADADVEERRSNSDSTSGKTNEPVNSTERGVGVAKSTSSVPRDCSRMMLALNVPMPSWANVITAETSQGEVEVRATDAADAGVVDGHELADVVEDRGRAGQLDQPASRTEAGTCARCSQSRRVMAATRASWAATLTSSST